MFAGFALKNDEITGAFWEWQNEGCWDRYDTESAAIEEQYQQSRTATFPINIAYRQYEINLKALTQHCKKKSF